MSFYGPIRLFFESPCWLCKLTNKVTDGKFERPRNRQSQHSTRRRHPGEQNATANGANNGKHLKKVAIITASEALGDVMVGGASEASEEKVELFSDTEYEGKSLVVQTSLGEVVQVDTLKQTEGWPTSPDAVPLFQENPTITPQVYERTVTQYVRRGVPALPFDVSYRHFLTGLALCFLLGDIPAVYMLCAALAFPFVSAMKFQKVIAVERCEHVIKREYSRGRIS